MRFSPGPWIGIPQFGPNGEFCFYSVEPHREPPAAYRGNVASVLHAENIDGITRDEAAANLRLIAAAPELLAALIGCTEHMEHSTEQGKLAYFTACALIEKVQQL